MAMRSVPLGERRADARALDEQIKAHRHDCLKCKPRTPCDGMADLRAELAQARADIKHWFDPGPDQGELWPTSA